MLVITRREQQKIMITIPTGEVITIQLIHLQPSQARIAIDAPLSFHVDRGEIHEQYKNIRKHLKDASAKTEA